MLNNSRIKELFALFSDLPPDQVSKWEHLCENSGKQLLSNLKPNVNLESNKERLATAAAAFAYADYLLLDGGSSTLSASQVKVGDISFGGSDGSSQAKQDSISIRQYFKEQVADLMVSDLYAFKPIGGKDYETKVH